MHADDKTRYRLDVTLYEARRAALARERGQAVEHDALASAANVDPRTLRNWRKGEPIAVDRNRRRKLAEALGVAESDLWSKEPAPPDDPPEDQLHRTPRPSSCGSLPLS